MILLSPLQRLCRRRNDTVISVMDPAKVLSGHLPIAPLPLFTLNQVRYKHAIMADDTINCPRILGRTMAVPCR